MENIFQKLCRLITNHKLRELIAWSEGIEPTEYHWHGLIGMMVVLVLAII